MKSFLEYKNRCRKYRKEKSELHQKCFTVLELQILKKHVSFKTKLLKWDRTNILIEIVEENSSCIIESKIPVSIAKSIVSSSSVTKLPPRVATETPLRMIRVVITQLWNIRTKYSWWLRNSETRRTSPQHARWSFLSHPGHQKKREANGVSFYKRFLNWRESSKSCWFGKCFENTSISDIWWSQFGVKCTGSFQITAVPRPNRNGFQLAGLIQFWRSNFLISFALIKLLV